MVANNDPIDLDARRANRGDPGFRSVIFGGETYEVPTKLSVALAIAATHNDVEGLVEGLFGDRMAEVLAVEPPFELEELLEIAGELAGGLGNLRGSTGS